MNATRKVKLKDITSNLTCPLCSGYLVDATTVIECLHSFCKSCIITYLEKSADLEEKYCPVCDVQLHSTKPLTSIRSDLMLQEIVYKLVPGLFKNEMRRRREFYEEHETCRPANPLDSGQVFDELYITSDDVMHLSLEYMTDDEKLRDSTRRYLKCPAAVGVFVLKKLLQGKYDLDKDTHIDIMFGDRILPDDFLLMDVAYKYSWAKNGNKPLDLRYRIKGTVKPTIKLERTINDSTVIAEPMKNSSQEDAQTTPTNKKKVCNENGSNIMTTEEIKHKPVKVPTNNGVIPGELTIAPIKHPNGKIKGRKRKHLNYSDIVIESKDDIKNLAKRLKLEKSAGSNNNKKLQCESFSSLAQLEISSSNNNEKSRPVKDVKEVQLQISENGVMSARSISCNGDDKVVYDLSKRVVSSSTTASTSTSPTTSQNISLTEKLLLSGNFHSKTGPNGLTEIICDKPAPSSSSMKQSTPKPGYVTLNIPTPKNPINGRVSSLTNDVGNKRFVSDLNGSPSSGEKNQLKTSTIDKLKQKVGAKEKDINGLTDLKKVCTGTSIEATDMMEMQRLPGKHSLPIIAPMGNPFQQQRSKNSNGNGTHLKSSIDTYVLPAALNFSPASGMSVSMIPCTTSGGTNGTNTVDGSKSLNGLSYRNNTPPKRSSHQSSIPNGEIKIRPKPILPKLNGDHQEISPKKPPKFFKSRQTSSPVSPFNGKHNTSMSPKHENSDSKRKTPVPMMMSVGSGEPTPKKANKERKDQQNEPNLPDSTAINFLNLLNAGVLAANAVQTSSHSGTSNGSSSNGLHALRQLAHSPQVNEKYSQQATALNNLATMQNATDPLNSGLGIAAVAAAAAAAAANNGNGLPLGMTPFVTDNYCSLPFLNQRQPMAAQFPFAFNFPGVGYTGTTFLTTATTTPVNTSKPRSSPLPTGSSGILNGLLSTPTSAKVMNNDSASTLDLSVAKSSAQDNASNTNSTDTNPLLVSLLNSNSKIKSPLSKSEDLNTKTVSPDTKRPADSTVKIPDKSKSPLIRQLLEKREEKEKANASSPGKKLTCDTTSNNKSDGSRDNKSDNDNRESPVNDKNSSKLNGNGTNGTTDKYSPVKLESNAKNDGSAANTESKLSAPTNGCSPTIQNDTNANNESTKVALDTAKLLCLSAQNNNNTLSNNHDKSNDSSKPNGNGLNDRDNGASDNNVPSTGKELVS